MPVGSTVPEGWLSSPSSHFLRDVAFMSLLGAAFSKHCTSMLGLLRPFHRKEFRSSHSAARWPKPFFLWHLWVGVSSLQVEFVPGPLFSAQKVESDRGLGVFPSEPQIPPYGSAWGTSLLPHLPGFLRKCRASEYEALIL